MKKKCYLSRKEHIPQKAMFPAVDAHNHLWGDYDNLGEIVDVMDKTGIVSYCDLTSNISLSWIKGGYVFCARDIRKFVEECVDAFPGRFYGFTTANLAQPVDKPLFTDSHRFVEDALELLRRHARCGAKGLKILKELGLHYRDGNGKLIAIDDERLSPIWEEAGKLGLPVLMHQSDPYGFFQPVKPDNEHYETLRKYPSWSFADSGRFPRKQELIDRRDRVIENHPNTVFMLPHAANFAENLSCVSSLLENHSNVYIDLSARIDELGRQPYTARKFIIQHQDRIYFGTDMPASPEMYRCYFRFLETYDEYFIPPDYDGTFDRYRWHICGLGLPEEVLRKIYYGNILKIIPDLQKSLEECLS
jgi:predicted TIM-barrel fold metal-dependent hydrolase